MSCSFTPSPAYRLFLSKLVQTRLDRGYSIEQLAEIIGLTPEPSKYARAAPLTPATVPTIQVLFFSPGETPEVRTIPNTLEAKQALVGWLITTFKTGVEGTVGVANDEVLLEDMPFNREISATSAHTYDPFLVAGDAPQGFRSLQPLELERALDMLCPEIGQEQFATIIATLEGGLEWMEMWN